ncbi:hypothetical protein [Streptacidiphilus anmyonensis]|uniref:hypothetical protein n=1 Tax=Streptacidiphilus anmyonensis TaxID=405782 RepID=UPI0005A8F056|nr:hypothetical protein [Streptacidiphilus anmyonensis]
MPDDIVIPDDLIDLQCEAYAAQALVEAFSNTVDAEFREVFPEEERWRQRIWPEDGDERAELQRLRAERNTALDRIRDHPAMAAARADGSRVQLDAALKRAGQRRLSGA